MIYPTEKDKEGLACDFSLCGKYFQHYKTKNVYKLTGYRFNATNDCWSVCYSEYDKSEKTHVSFTRDISDFFGLVPDEQGFLVPRFKQVGKP